MARPARPLVSVVFSFRNEADNIPTLVGRLEKMFAGQDVDYEVIFVNDASTDASLSLLVAERQRNPRITIVNMSRRFGVAEGVIAGMATSHGDAVVYMDADLQDPPEVIPALIDRWRQGADVVHTVRTRRHGENALKMAATRVAYRLIQLGSSIELPVDAGDFKLLSRPAVDHLLRLRESDPYLRGLVVWLGFNQVLHPVRTGLASRRPHALPVLQPQSVEDVHDRPHVVLVHAHLRLLRARCRGSAGGADARPCRIAVHGRAHVLLGDDDWRDRRRRHLSHPCLQGCERPPAVHN